jgi:hypothetical protein
MQQPAEDVASQRVGPKPVGRTGSLETIAQGWRGWIVGGEQRSNHRRADAERDQQGANLRRSIGA